MRILYIHQYFRTPQQGGALRSYYLAQALVEAGHQVEMVTAHNEPAYRRQLVDGMVVHYLPVAYDNALGFKARVRSFLRFAWHSTSLALRLEDIDLCYATSTPITVGGIAFVLKKLKGIPFYFEVRDLWPEAPIQLGYIRNKWLIRLLRAGEHLLYREAEKVIALSPGMAAGIAPYKPASALYLLPNMADTAFYQPVSPPRSQPQDPFRICYTGALARANRLDFLLDIARLCQERHLSQVQFHVAGTGAEAARLESKSKTLGLTNITFLGFLDREGIRSLLQSSHATYTSFDTQVILQTNSPNKFFDSLAAGKLTLVNTRGWLQDLVSRHQCGFYADPFRPEDFVAQLQPYLQEPALVEQAGLRARQLAEQEFSRSRITGQFLALFG